MKWPHPIRNHRARVAARWNALGHATLQSGILSLQAHGIKVEHTVKHLPRPPAPRPEQATLTFIATDGREYKLSYNLNGGRGWEETIPLWVEQQIRDCLGSMRMRIDLRYADGGTIY